ncbi:tRNA-dihydrouridine(20a/20b) synthase [NAD(P)+]-like protein [Irineochytrium annulatum]|nr:tRNA-dihydrouridine(20a/20b) synthase [NAD(P)+]-like protein [Irineochytrium annulatum]
MAARGLLQNPALFAGHGSTPLDAMKAYLKLRLVAKRIACSTKQMDSIGYGTTFFILHHHLMYMLEKAMSRAEKKRFNSLSSTGAVVDYMEEHYGLVWGS